VSPHNRELTTLSSRWSDAIVVRAVMAFIAYGILGAMVTARFS
jgi:hypothetical protein